MYEVAENRELLLDPSAVAEYLVTMEVSDKAGRYGKNGETPLHWASEHGKTECVQLLSVLSDLVHLYTMISN